MPYPPETAAGIVDQLVNRWLDEMTDVAATLHVDPTAAALHRTLRTALVQAEIVMRDEGLADDVRRRIITAALFGSVDVEEALRRRREHERQVKLLEQMPMPPMTKAALDLLRGE